MDPISASLMAVGLGMQIFGGVSSASTQKQIAASSGRVAGLEQQADAQRKQQMELDANRKQLEVFRNSQRARALALNNATSSGSQFGSGLQGGYGQIAGASGTNLLGIGQNLEIGENLFGINSKISSEKMMQASLGGDLASSQAISGIGKSFSGAAMPAGALGSSLSGIFGGSPGATGRGPG